MIRRSVLGWLLLSAVGGLTFGLTSLPGNPLQAVAIVGMFELILVTSLIREFFALKNWDLVLVRCKREDPPFGCSPRNFKIFIGAFIEPIWQIRPSVVRGDMTVLLLSRKCPARSLPLGAVNMFDATALEKKWLDYSNDRFVGLEALVRP